jgi:pimeloyl-ACP methyl ester carboxylesterase
MNFLNTTSAASLMTEGDGDRPWKSYDYDTLADDLNEVITQLNLEKVVLVGFRWRRRNCPLHR